MSRTINLIFIVGIISIALLAACTSNATPAPPTARLTEITNQVETRATATGAFTPATVGMTLAPNMQIRTGAQSKARIDFGDGSIVRLSENTLLTLEEFRQDNHPLARFGMELGKIWVSVFGGTFELQTPVGVATVRGSFATFQVVLEKPDDPASVTLVMDCLEGSCTARNEQANVSFGNLERVIVPKSAPAIKHSAAPAEALPEFLQNNPNPEGQRIVPTLTAAPQMTKTRIVLPTSEPFRTATPAPRNNELRTVVAPSRTSELVLPRLTFVPSTTPILRPLTPELPRATATPMVERATEPVSAVRTLIKPTEPMILTRPTDPIIIVRPTDPIIVKPTDPIIVKPTEPRIIQLPTSPPIIIRPTAAPTSKPSLPKP